MSRRLRAGRFPALPLRRLIYRPIRTDATCELVSDADDLEQLLWLFAEVDHEAGFRIFPTDRVRCHRSGAVYGSVRVEPFPLWV
jgi:hypothetical protein